MDPSDRWVLYCLWSSQFRRSQSLLSAPWDPSVPSDPSLLTLLAVPLPLSAPLDLWVPSDLSDLWLSPFPAVP